MPGPIIDAYKGPKLGEQTADETERRCAELRSLITDIEQLGDEPHTSELSDRVLLACEWQHKDTHDARLDHWLSPEGARLLERSTCSVCRKSTTPRSSRQSTGCHANGAGRMVVGA